MSAIDAISMIQRGVTEITVESLNIGSAGNSYSFPETVGTNGQILVLNNDSLIWGSGGGGGISALTNTDGNISISGSSVVTVNLESAITVNEVNIGTAYTLPTVAGTANQVLAMPASGNACVWKNDSAGSGTVTNVSSGNSNITVTNATTTPVVSLASDLNVSSVYGYNVNATLIGIGNNSPVPDFVFPQINANPPINTLIISAGGGSSSFGTASSLLNNTDGNISLTNNGSNITVIDLASSLQLEGLSIHNQYTFPATIGSPNQVLAVPGGGSTLYWKNDNAGTGTVTNVSGDANFIVTNQTTTPSISLASTVEIDTLNINNAYTLPSTIGSANQVLSVPVSGTTLTWKNDAAGTGTVTNVSSGNSNIVVTNNTTTPVVSLQNEINITNLTATGGIYGLAVNASVLGLADGDSNPQFVFPLVSSNPPINTLIVSDGNGSSTFSTINGLFNNTDGNITLTNGGSNTTTINMDSTVNLNTLTLGNAYTFPATIGTPNQVLSVPNSGSTLTWSANGSGSTSCFVYAALTGMTYVTDALAVINSTNSQHSNNISFPTTTSITLPINSTFIFNCYLNNTSLTGANSVAVTLDTSNITGYTTTATMYGNDMAFSSGIINTGNTVGSAGLLLTFSQILPGPISFALSGNSYFTLTSV